MSYLALARRYRPENFTKLLAQSHITRTLSSAVDSGRVSHAYLFCGPRGTGKTSAARILAKSVNCQKGPSSSPCGECVNCREIKAGISPDVFEIDAASNRGIDDIRELRENVRYAPVSSRYKIYIIDEVHRLTNEAFDALLKTLEEPPRQVIFIFATTEPQKLPATILSRTQRFDFKRIPVSSLAETVGDVAAKEGLRIEARAALMVARKADGSLRDALSLLDQLISFSEGNITAEATAEILGLIKTDFLFELTGAIIRHDTPAVLELFNIYFGEGSDIDELATELASFLGRLLLIKNGIKDAALLEMDSMEREKAATLIELVDTADILRMTRILADFIRDKKSGIDPMVAMEIALAGLAGMDKSIDIGRLLIDLGDAGHLGNRHSGSSTQTVARQSYSPESPAKSPEIDPGEQRRASPPAPPPEIAPSGPHDLADIGQWWPNFLGFIKAKSMALWVNLQHAVIEKVEDNTLYLGFSEQRSANRKMLAKDKKSLLTQLQEFCGNNVGLGLVKSSLEKDSASIKPAMPAQGAEEFLQQHPQIKKLHDLIDGEIIRFGGIA